MSGFMTPEFVAELLALDTEPIGYLEGVPIYQGDVCPIDAMTWGRSPEPDLSELGDLSFLLDPPESW